MSNDNLNVKEYLYNHRQTLSKIGDVIYAASYEKASKAPLDFRLSREQIIIEALTPRAGWLQRYLRIAGQLGSMCVWKPYYRGKLVEGDALVDRLLASIKPFNMSQQEMRARSITLQQKLGCQAIEIIPVEGDLDAYCVHHPDALHESKDYRFDGYMLQTSQNQKRREFLPIPASNILRHGICKDSKFADDTSSPVSIILSELELYCCLYDMVHATAEQKKIVSELIHFKPDNNLDANGYIVSDKPGISDVQEVVDGFLDMSEEAYNNPGPARTFPYPFAFSGSINNISLGQMVDTASFEVLFASIRHAAAGLEVSGNWLVNGAGGNANRWGDAEARREMHTQVVSPSLQLNDGFWTEKVWQPIIERMQKVQHSNIFAGTNPDDWEVRSDQSCIEVKPDNADQLLELYKCGVVTREEVAAAASAELLDIGDISELEWLTRVNGGQAEEPAASGEIRSEPEPATVVQAAAFMRELESL